MEPARRVTSNPPQCDGATVRGWDWSLVDADSAAGVSFGVVQVVGTWDADSTTLTVTRPLVVPPPVAVDAPLPVVAEARRRQLEQIEAELRDRPDLLDVDASALEDHVAVTTWVVPDGLQDELDDEYGDGTVQVHGRLAPVD